LSEPRPIGMRIPRPYATEEEFIQGDGLAIGRMGMILIGAPARPPGIVVRFELLLKGGEPVFRGEGKVVAHRVHANGRQGLEVRFTRLDKHSKALVERVLALRKTGALTPAASPGAPEVAEGVDKVGLERPSQPEAPEPRTSTPEPEAAAKPETEPEPPAPAVPDLQVLREPHAPATSEAEHEPPHAPEPPHEHAPEPHAKPLEQASIAQSNHAPAPTTEPAPAAEPDATVVDARVAEIEATATQDEPDDSPPRVEPPIDDAPTPFMPPVTVDDHERERDEKPADTNAAPASDAGGDAVADALRRLRARNATFEPSPQHRAALDKLRARLHP
jgi:hypothetical protein